jgi:hypothetical protein
MATTGYDVLSGLKAVPVAKPTVVTPASIAAAQAAVAATEKIAAKTEAKAVRAADPLTNKSVAPPAPAGTTPVWVGGTDTGGWKFQTNTVQGPVFTGGQPTGSTGPVPYAPTGPSASDMASRQNIFDQVQALFTTYGIIKPGDPASDALLKTIKDLAMSGAGADTISLQLQQSDAYKARFAGNETRRAAGLNVLSPAEYIATENAYDQILRASGVPTGFYNSSAEKAKLIGADVSASELQSRVDLAAKSISGADPFYTQQLQNLYGLSQGDMIAHVLDPAAAMPLLQQQAQSTTIAAAAARNATNINLTTAQQLAGMGITQAQAEQGFGSIANQLPGMQAIASRYQGYGDAGTVGTGLQAATFGAPIGGETAAQAEARLKRLQTQETSAFGGSAGASTQGQSLGVGNQQGSI